jgi:hypothetical protein
MHWSAMLTNEFAKLIVNGEGGSHENGFVVCGDEIGIVVELFGRNQLWWFWRWWWLIFGLTGRWMKVGEVKGPGSACEVPGSSR